MSFILVGTSHHPMLILAEDSRRVENFLAFRRNSDASSPIHSSVKSAAIIRRSKIYKRYWRIGAENLRERGPVGEVGRGLDCPGVAQRSRCQKGYSPVGQSCDRSEPKRVRAYQPGLENRSTLTHDDKSALTIGCRCKVVHGARLSSGPVESVGRSQNRPHDANGQKYAMAELDTDQPRLGRCVGR